MAKRKNCIDCDADIRAGGWLMDELGRLRCIWCTSDLIEGFWQELLWRAPGNGR